MCNTYLLTNKLFLVIFLGPREKEMSPVIKYKRLAVTGTMPLVTEIEFFEAKSNKAAIKETRKWGRKRENLKRIKTLALFSNPDGDHKLVEAWDQKDLI